MSLGPVLIVSDAERPTFARALEEAQLVPLVTARFDRAAMAAASVKPVAVLVVASGLPHSDLSSLAGEISAHKPYVPLILVGPSGPPPNHSLPLWPADAHGDRVLARLRAALRVRALHATVLRRLAAAGRADMLREVDMARDATALLIGRGGSYPALSVAFGERMGVIGALSIEAAARHLNIRDIDGVVLGEGFTPRVVDAFLTVLSEDTRFRNLPVIVAAGQQGGSYALPNLELLSGAPSEIVTSALPLIRQRAFETHLNRILHALDAGGLLDSDTGLLTGAAFARDFSSAVSQSLGKGGNLSIARFAFDPANRRALLDAARIVSRLKRRSDFGVAHRDGSVIVVFPDTDLRNARTIARRLSSVMRQTSNGRRSRSDAVVTIETLLPTDTAKSLLSRLYGGSAGEDAVQPVSEPA